MTSVAPASPPLCGKRNRHCDEPDILSPTSHGKRHRTGRLTDASAIFDARSSLHFLLSRFPGMDDKVITQVLDACEGDLHEALAKLNELSLSGVARDQRAYAGSREDEKAHAAASPSSSTPPLASSPRRSAAPSVRAAEQPELAKWAEAFCNEMAAATDVQDAKARAEKFLAEVKAHVERAKDTQHAAQMDNLAKENSVLKRAVAIQHARMREATEKDTQLQTLQAAVSQYEERCRALEMANYSLSLHLKQATRGTTFAGGRPPDVF